MCGCDFCISAKSMHSYLLSWRDFYLNKLKDLSQSAKNIRSSEMDNILFETYKKYFMPHGCLIYQTESDRDMSTICAYTPSQHELPHCKCVLRCCEKISHIYLPGQE